ncbi:nuclease-related domain-containing protein [Metabacillus elymi]|uniref:NERD domain-containing protein n=1 Tax=Metabacillus elymi TaxID=2745198 RepID=A0ABX6S6K9_9BACI|nr:nuclease-related domain-containing protein [Metabacillus sp. KUDC1714]QNF29649.1 NERD domain-containing protein [Metabacillus sp. KUDC1714]
MFTKFFKKNKVKKTFDTKKTTPQSNQVQNINKVKPTRIGDIGEYKINIQLDQIPKDCRYLSDILVPNSKSKSGYSQIDHVVLTPYAVFVIETKNYQGTIYGGKDRKTWSVNGKFNMLNPFHQNYGHISALKAIVPIENTNIVSMVSFTKRCTFKVDLELRKIQSKNLIVYDIELFEFINRKLNVLKLQNGSPVYSENDIVQMYQKVERANIRDSEVRERHVRLLKSNATKETSNGVQKKTSLDKCKVCGTVVPLKVKEYCLSNNKRFKGEIYCFEHQKIVVNKG